MIWYNQGIHIKLNGIHILCDPTYTTDEHKEWKDYNALRKKNSMNKDYLDVDLIAISHAHADHIDRLEYFSETHVKILAHPMTIDLKSSLFGNFENIQSVKEGDCIEFKGIKIHIYNSGHCGGSIMFLFEINNTKILFTGDLNTQITASTYPARSIKCDILIIESTFGDPKYSFPPRDQVYHNIYTYLNTKFESMDVILMFGQALGKVQDIVKLVRNFKHNNIKIALDGYSYICTQIYEKHYGKINHEINHFDKNLLKPPKQSYIQLHEIFNPTKKTLIMLHMSKDTILETIPKISKSFGLIDPPIILLSGLEKEILQPIIDMYNPMIYKVSNHSDYSELVKFTKRCNPSKVCVFHGRAKKFKEEASKELNAKIYYLHGEKCDV